MSADDLPLNVSRETLQNTSFLRQIKQAILKRIIQTFARLSEEEPEKFAEAQKVYGTAFKLGVVEDSKNSDKLALLMRFATNQRNSASLDDVCSSRIVVSMLANNHSQYIENKKAGQKQIFYVSDAGKSVSSLAKSVFVEKLHARGYEVLLLTDSIDEILLHHLRKWKWVYFTSDLYPQLNCDSSEASHSRTQPRLDSSSATRVSLNVEFTRNAI